MPTLRSEYHIEQFEEVLQKLAHEFPKFREARTDDVTLIFYYTEDGKPRKVTVQFHKRTGKKSEWGDDEIEYWSFTIERKEYMDSNHVSKITFGHKEDEERTEGWLKKIMASEKPKPRFTLRNMLLHK